MVSNLLIGEDEDEGELLERMKREPACFHVHQMACWSILVGKCGGDKELAGELVDDPGYAATVPGWLGERLRAKGAG